MGQFSKIEWTHHTFNPWWGCMKVSPACDHCYAETLANRFGKHWGPKADYRTFSDKHWNEPLRWNRAAEKAGERHRVFCASMADVFDNRAPEGARERLWELIRRTPHLDWLLLTKRPQNIQKMLPEDWGCGYPNVWLGVTVENQHEADRRVPILQKISARVRFLSCEPLLSPVNLARPLQLMWQMKATFCVHTGALGPIESSGWRPSYKVGDPLERPIPPDIHWVIVGGESGPGARPTHPNWVRDLRDQCAAAGVAFHFKQHGDWASHDQIGANGWRFTRSIDGRRFGVLTQGDFGETETLFGGEDFETLYPWEDGTNPCMVRAGKKHAGRLLDGREWNGLPDPAPA